MKRKRDQEKKRLKEKEQNKDIERKRDQQEKRQKERELQYQTQGKGKGIGKGKSSSSNRAMILDKEAIQSIDLGHDVSSIFRDLKKRNAQNNQEQEKDQRQRQTDQIQMERGQEHVQMDLDAGAKMLLQKLDELTNLIKDGFSGMRKDQRLMLLRISALESSSLVQGGIGVSTNSSKGRYKKIK